MRTRPLLAAIAMVLSVPAVSQAHYLDQNSKWIFGGAHLKTADVTSNRTLPMNIFFYGDAYLTSEGRTDRLLRHVQQHSRLNATNDGGLDFGSGFSSGCSDNKRFLDMPRGQDPATANNNNLVMWASGQPGSKDRCRTRYHARLWYDDDHPGGSHNIEANRWIVGSLHHEQHLKGAVGSTHYFDQHWDDVEFHMTQIMRAVRDPHDDPRGKYPNAGHCTNFNWKKLPGSRGWFGGKQALPPNHKGKGYWSDGAITRISMDHCPR